jgi:hypothetical protein
MPALDRDPVLQYFMVTPPARRRNLLGANRNQKGITRPAIANERLSRNGKGEVVLQLKSPIATATPTL